MSIGIALDLGTSGFRAQAIDLESEKIISSALTTHHPIPGGNVIDHILFALTFGQSLTHRIVVKTINRLLHYLASLNEIELIAACGNPTQISLFTGIDVKDLALSQNSLEREGIAPSVRDAQRINSEIIGLETSCDVLIPPAIKAEVGADAIAMICKSGMLKRNIAIATDYGTNAEIALKVGNDIYVGSAAAGPAIEGQHIKHGMLASPGAIADMEYDWGWKNLILDAQLEMKDGDTVDISTGRKLKKSRMRAKGITGTGVISLISIALASGYINPPKITTPSKKLFLQDGIEFTEEDLLEAGKAFGAIRAGQKTLAEHAGILLEDVNLCYMAGAAGSYVDPLKARDVGLIPASTEFVYQIGNTSLGLAIDLVLGEEKLENLQKIAGKAKHIAFSNSEIFKKNYLRELAYWCEGAKYPEERKKPAMDVLKILEKAAPKVVHLDQPNYLIRVQGCNVCLDCVKRCPKNALELKENYFQLNLKKCLGASCLVCEQACKEFRMGSVVI